MTRPASVEGQWIELGQGESLTGAVQAELGEKSGERRVAFMAEALPLARAQFQAEVYRDDRGMTAPLPLAIRLAEMPCGAIKGNSPARLLREVAAGQPH